MRRTLSATILTLSMLLLCMATPSASATEGSGEIASFEGRRINLDRDWEGATACTTDGSRTQCFRTEAQMDEYLERNGTQDVAAPATVMATCSTTLRLYSGTSFSGQVLSLSTRQLWINLSGYGFDNITSSFKVGACAAYLADLSNGGTPWYPGSTGANSQASTMVTGWSDRISSVYIT